MSWILFNADKFKFNLTILQTFKNFHDTLKIFNQYTEAKYIKTVYSKMGRSVKQNFVNVINLIKILHTLNDKPLIVYV